MEPTLRRFQEMISKYQFMEMNLQKRVSGLKDKIPDIQKTLETVSFLKLQKVRIYTIFFFHYSHWRLGTRASNGSANKLLTCRGTQDKTDSLETTFELNDTLYAKATIPPTDEVFLWLGANIMLSYPVDEAKELLKGKLETARQTLSNCEEDLDFLREQITTMEVAIARVYNWDVVQRRKEKEEGKG